MIESGYLIIIRLIEPVVKHKAVFEQGRLQDKSQQWNNRQKECGKAHKLYRTSISFKARNL